MINRIFNILICCMFWACSAAAGDEKMIAHIEAINAGIHQFELPNGMKCIVREDHAAPVVTVQIWVGSGAVHQGTMLGAGIAHAVEHMFFKGTPTRDVGRVFRDISDAGGKMNAYTSDDRTVYHVDLPARNWKVALDVLSDAIMNPLFPADEWKKEQQVIMREISMRDDSPDRLLYDYAGSTAYTTHPYRYPVIGYKDVFAKVTRNDLVDYYQRNYYPENMVTVIVGDIRKNEIEQAVRTAFAGFERKPPTSLYIPVEPEQVAERSSRYRAEARFSRLMLGYHITPMNHADTPALDMLAMIAGSGASSRLVSRLKEKEKLVYNIGVSSYTPRYPGLFTVYAEFDPANEKKVLSAIEEELAGLLQKNVGADELRKAKRMMSTGMLNQKETVHGQAEAFASAQMLIGNPCYDAIYLKELFSITPEKLKETARKYIRPSGKNLCIMMPKDADVAAEDDKKELPGVQYKLPVRRVLGNGMPVIIREDHRMPYVYFSVVLGGGVISETEKNNGITTLTSELMAKGTKSMTGEEIDRMVDSTGGSISPFSGSQTFGINAKCLSSDFKSYAVTVVDMVMKPVIAADETEKQKILQIADIARGEESIVWLGVNELRKSLFPGHPYRLNALGTRDSVKSLTRDQVAGYLADKAVTGNAALAVFGDISSEDALRICEATFGRVRQGKCEEPKRVLSSPVLPSQAKQRVRKQQTFIISGLPGVSISDRRYEELSVIHQALSGMSSDLSDKIREQRGLAYYASCTMMAGADPGFIALFAGTREDAAAEVDRLMQEEMARIREKGLRDDEFARAINQIISAQELGLQDNLATAQSCAVNEVVGLGYMRTYDVRDRFSKVSQDGVRKTARELLDPEKTSTIFLLPAANK